MSRPDVSAKACVEFFLSHVKLFLSPLTPKIFGFCKRRALEPYLRDVQ